MSERIWGKRRLRTGVRWLWIENNGGELLSRSKLTNSCRAKRRSFRMQRFYMESTEHEKISAPIFTETIWKAELRALTLWSRQNCACSETSGSIVKQRLVFTFRGPVYTQNVLCWLRTQGVASTQTPCFLTHEVS